MVLNKDGAIKQTLISFAQRRGLDVTIARNQDGQHIWIWDLENECEPLVMYRVNDDGSLTYHASLFSKLEDLPAWIGERAKLFKLLDYVADMLKAEKM